MQILRIQNTYIQKNFNHCIENILIGKSYWGFSKFYQRLFTFEIIFSFSDESVLFQKFGIEQKKEKRCLRINVIIVDILCCDNLNKSHFGIFTIYFVFSKIIKKKSNHCLQFKTDVWEDGFLCIYYCQIGA